MNGKRSSVYFWHSRYHHRIIGLSSLVLLGLLVSVNLPSAMAQMPIHALSQSTQTTSTPSLLQQGLERYQAGNFSDAIALWQQANAHFANQRDELSQALTWRYLSLAYQDLGQWQLAETAIATSLKILQHLPASTQKPVYYEVLAKALNTQGRLQWEKGKLAEALSTWRSATLNYQKAGHTEGILSSLINQAKTLQALGLNIQARNTLQIVYQMLNQQPATDLKSTGLLDLGRALRKVGALDESIQRLQESLAIATQPATRSAILLELGNTASDLAASSLAIEQETQAQSHLQSALMYYQQAAQLQTSPLLTLQAQLNQLSLLVDTQQWRKAAQLWQSLKPLVDELPPSRAAVYAQLNFAHSLMQIISKQDDKAFHPSRQTIAQLLVRAIQQAQTLNDPATESYALGQLGALYELNQQWSDAKMLTQRALLRLEGLDAPEIRYRWEWQLGRLLQQQHDFDGAIAAYQQAIRNLESVRNDLLLVDSEIQFSFRDQVEPIYREVVDLLLKPGLAAEVSQTHLQQVVSYVDALQLAELENFLRCDLSQTAGLLNQTENQVNHNTAFIYPILLNDRLEVIYRLPGQPLKHRTQSISKTEAERTIRELLRAILRGNAGGVIARSKQIYQWIIAPLEADLNRNDHVKTLVFVLDGELRNVPMAVLYDAQTNQYLIEKPYGIALLPSSHLFDLRIEPKQAQVLGAGISEPLQVGDRNFTALNVNEELAQIQQSVSSEILLNAQFTRSHLQEKLNSAKFSVIHLATHGNFSSNPNETYILIHSAETNKGELLKANEFDRLLRDRQNSTKSAIDLLILSACQTAEGDRRATLGLAGLAVRAGARSTLATLWQVSDASTVKLMQEFYKTFNQPGITKAEALRHAQIKLLKNPQYQAPYYWAPYVLVGNWR